MRAVWDRDWPTLPTVANTFGKRHIEGQICLFSGFLVPISSTDLLWASLGTETEQEALSSKSTLGLLLHGTSVALGFLCLPHILKQ